MRVVFDTNVVVSACFWRGAPFECLSRWAGGGIVALISPPLLVEHEETRDELRIDYPDRPMVDWVEAMAASAEMIFPVERVSGATPDPFDGMVLECALAGEAGCIVSGDNKHLLSIGNFRGIPLLGPGEFLRRYGENNPTL
ncbi:MAG: putative toxin-antitoxin system toxin component, PIN family [Puniceicoccaceae bacterium]